MVEHVLCPDVEQFVRVGILHVCRYGGERRISDALKQHLALLVEGEVDYLAGSEVTDGARGEATALGTESLLATAMHEVR